MRPYLLLGVAALCMSTLLLGAYAGHSGSDLSDIEQGLLRHYNTMKHRMMEVTPEYAEDAIVSAARKHKIRKASLIELVAQATEWGDVRSFNHVFSYLESGNKFLFMSRDMATLSDVLGYVLRKKWGYDNEELYFGQEMDDEEQWFYTVDAAMQRLGANEGRKMVVLLDHIIERRIALGDEDLKQQLKLIMEIDCKAKGFEDGCVEVAVLRGWLGGIHAFNQYEFTKLVDSLAAKYAHYMAEKVSENEAIEAILEGPVERLVDDILGNGHGMLRSVKVKHITRPTDIDEFSTNDFERISANLRPQYPTFEEFRDKITSVAGDCPDIASLPEVLNKEAKYYSMNGLYVLTQRIHRKILKHAEDLAELAGSASGSDAVERPEPESPYYIIPEFEKSFTLATHLYLTANNDADPRKVKYMADTGLRAIWSNANPPFSVILDDYSGSGQSLYDVASDLCDTMDEASVRKVLVAPLLQSFYSAKAFKKENVLSVYGEELYGITGRIEVDPDAAPNLWMGGPGYNNGFFFVTLPLMSPDNDASLFSRHLAPLFVLSPKGVKNKTFYDVLCTPESRFETVVTRTHGRIHLDSKDFNPDVPAQCRSFVLQHYCKTTPMYDGQECPMTHGIDSIIEDLQQADSVWSSKYGLEDGLSAVCVKEGLADLKKYVPGLFENGRKSGSYAITNCSRVCEILRSGSENTLRKQIEANVNDGGLYGWSVPKIARARMESEDPCVRDARQCGP